DAVAAIGLAAVTYRLYYAPWLRFPQTAEEVRALTSAGRRVWVLLTLPPREVRAGRGARRIHATVEMGGGRGVACAFTLTDPPGSGPQRWPPSCRWSRSAS